jgi:quinol monooxygenase YgiN
MADQKFTLGDLNAGFVVTIYLEAKPGEEEKLARCLRTLVEPTMAEPSVKLFLPYRSPTDPRVFFVYELYAEEAGWAAHQKTSHFKAFIDEMLPRLARRERIPFVPFTTI